MSWFSEGFDEAEKNVVGGSRRKGRNLWTKAGEAAVIRFLKPAKESFNYKRAFVPWVKGQKTLTSPGEAPDPFVEAGLQLQAAFAWPVIDRRTFEFEGEKDGQKTDIKVGPRVLYFADGQRTRKALISFENEMREQINEERAEEGKPALTEDEHNLSHYDIKIKKDKGAPWMFVAVRGGKAKPLSKDDTELVENNPIDLLEELRPLPLPELHALLRQEPAKEASATTEYSYGTGEEEATDGPTFFDD